jgi:hypothetical protein
MMRIVVIGPGHEVVPDRANPGTWLLRLFDFDGSVHMVTREEATDVLAEVRCLERDREPVPLRKVIGR